MAKQFIYINDMKKEEIIEVLKFHATEPIPNTNQLAIPPYHFDSIAKELSEQEDKISDEAIKICPYKGKNYKNCKKWQKFKNGCAECDYIWEYCGQIKTK